MKYFIYFISLLFCACSNTHTEPKVELLQSFESEYIQNRNVSIWLPANYNKKTKYNVLYMHDGQMLFDSTSTWNGQAWLADETIQHLIDAKTIQPTIIIGIWNIEKLRTIEYWPRKAYNFLNDSVKEAVSVKRLKQAPLSDNYLKFIVEELKPYVDKNYNTNTAKQNTFIAGSSMGGLISMYAICEYPEVFEAAACLSTHWPGTYEANDAIPESFVKYLKNNLPNPDTHKIYFDYGTETLDELYEPYQLMIDSVMREKGYTSENWITLKFEGEAHKETDWAKRFNIPIEFIMKK